jgi:translation initiation factor 2 alpha subunit (eIF-2alpha)
MKKMIFSAVALVAFSFAGMANELKEEKVETNKKVIAKSLMTTDCNKLANDTMDVYEAAGWSVEEAYEKGLEVYNVCIGKTKKLTQA